MERVKLWVNIIYIPPPLKFSKGYLMIEAKRVTCRMQFSTYMEEICENYNCQKVKEHKEGKVLHFTCIGKCQHRQTITTYIYDVIAEPMIIEVTQSDTLKTTIDKTKQNSKNISSNPQEDRKRRQRNTEDKNQYDRIKP